MPGFEINHVTVSGNLTRDPELRSLSDGTSVCSLRIACNERVKDGLGDWTDKPNYFDVSIWKGVGEYVARSLTKGDKIVVEGKLKWREWETQDGQKRQAVDITAFSVVPVPRSDRPMNPNADIPIDRSDLQSREGVAATPRSQQQFAPTPSEGFRADTPPPRSPADDEDDIPF